MEHRQSIAYPERLSQELKLHFVAYKCRLWYIIRVHRDLIVPLG